jgi:AAA domain-containing protein
VQVGPSTGISLKEEGPAPVNVEATAAAPAATGPLASAVPAASPPPPATSVDDGGGPKKMRNAAIKFPPPVPISHLATTAAATTEWIWKGYLPERAIVLFTALWKAGKTTLLTHLLKAMSDGRDEFCGLPLRPGKVLVVTQETDAIWNDRQKLHGLKDEIVHFQRGADDYPQPFKGKPSRLQWEALIRHLADCVRRDGYKLVVIDPLPDFWPVKDENDASEQTAALLPLRQITYAGACVLLLHHPRKSDGNEGTAARGSGALSGFVDVILEMRRSNPKDLNNPRRVLTGLSRYNETPRELVVELTANGYVARGTKGEAASVDEGDSILSLLPHEGPGATVKELAPRWKEGKGRKPDTVRRRLSGLLQDGHKDRKWNRDGEGTRSKPFRYWRAA